jgi:hypothetical protein
MRPVYYSFFAIVPQMPNEDIKTQEEKMFQVSMFCVCRPTGSFGVASPGSTTVWSPEFFFYSDLKKHSLVIK